MGLPAVVSCGGTTSGGGGDNRWHGGGGGGGSGTGISNFVEEPAPGDPCGMDQLDETVCGATSPSTCGPMGDSLTSYGNSQLYVTQGSYGANDPTFKSFWLDAGATESYRSELRTSNPGLPYDQYCCYSHCTTLSSASSAELNVPAGYHTQPACIPAPPAGTSAPSAANAACPGAVILQGELRPYESGDGATCCYSVVVQDPEPYEERHYRGRPARIDGTAVYAPVAPGRAWSSADLAPALAALPAETRARLAAVWTEVARMEHASIASFANLALRLMAAGAPPELIAATHRAALDEIEHARIAFGLASAYAGEPIGPGAFADAARMSPEGGIGALAVETFLDGCIGETVAAAEAGWAAARAADPAIAGALRTMAEDETRHAELAWAIVAWCVRSSGPALVARLERTLSTAQGTVDEVADPAASELWVHGVVPPHDLAQLRRAVIGDVVTPCLAALAE